VDWLCRHYLKAGLYIANIMSVCCIQSDSQCACGSTAREDCDMHVRKFKVCGCNVRTIADGEICVCFVAEGHFIYQPTITVCLIMIQGTGSLIILVEVHSYMAAFAKIISSR
jgi:hypothetical protein